MLLVKRAFLYYYHYISPSISAMRASELDGIETS